MFNVIEICSYSIAEKNNRKKHATRAAVGGASQILNFILWAS